VRPVSDPEDIAGYLIEQVTGRVRWRETIEFLSGNGASTLCEVGAGKVLSGLARRIDRNVATLAIGTPAEVEAALAALS
jgi:[acyl-carrier-protein] S-malonyltransferase